jgi:hypothetical protein
VVLRYKVSPFQRLQVEVLEVVFVSYVAVSRRAGRGTPGTVPG